MPTQRVLVTGAHGFVGRHVTAELLRRGYAVNALLRHPKNPIPQPNPSILQEFAGDILQPATLPRALAHCQAVIHLVGIIAERAHTFEQVHVAGTRNVLNAARNAGIIRFIHMSALGTRPNAVSRYHQTKFQAEELLRESPLDYTIFQPSLILGPDGEFATMLRQWAQGQRAPYLFLPYFGTGLLGQSNPHRIQPVHVDDIATLFALALTTPASIRQTYQVAGPTSYTWPEMLRIAAHTFAKNPQHPKPTLGIPAWYAKLLTMFPIPLPFNRDQVLMALEDNTADLAPLQRDFPTLTLRDLPSSLTK